MNDTIRELFHRLWTKAVGTTDYDKKEWQRLEEMLVNKSSPDDIRAAGWTVAGHNDYRLDGKSFTFWLFTHPDGRWAKGEGRDDAEALDEVRRSKAFRRQ